MFKGWLMGVVCGWGLGWSVDRLPAMDGDRPVPSDLAMATVFDNESGSTQAGGKMTCGEMPYEVAWRGDRAEEIEFDRLIMIDVYYRGDVPEDAAWLQWARDFADKRPGLQVVGRDVAKDPALAERLQSIRSALKLPPSEGPVIFGFNRAIHEVRDAADCQRQLGELLKIEMYSKPNCPHCDQAERYFQATLRQYPALTFVKRNVQTDRQAEADLQTLLKRRKTTTSTVPVLHVANQLLIGFDQAEKSGDKVDEVLQRWSATGPNLKKVGS